MLYKEKRSPLQQPKMFFYDLQLVCGKQVQPKSNILEIFCDEILFLQIDTSLGGEGEGKNRSREILHFVHSFS